MKVIEPTDQPTPKGHYSPAIEHHGVVYVSGQLPMTLDTREPFAGDIEKQTELALANVEILVFSSSSYRQSFCFLIRKHDLDAALEALNANLAIELAHGYLNPIQVDENVGLLAVVGEGMRGTPGLAGRIFTAISRERINIIAIAQGSSELTIGIIVRLDGLERAVQAVHSECHLGTPSFAASLG